MTRASKGDRVRLVHTDDEYTQTDSGTEGTVTSIDTIHIEGAPDQIWVDWDDGSHWALLEGEDEYEILD